MVDEVSVFLAVTVINRCLLFTSTRFDFKSRKKDNYNSSCLFRKSEIKRYTALKFHY